MSRKRTLYFAAGFGLVVLALAAGYLWRPIVIIDGGTKRTFQAAVLTTGQALYAAGVALDPADRVTPALDQVVPINGQIYIQRAVQALVWDEGKARLVRGYTRTPAALLAEANIALGADDRLLWNGQPMPVDMELPAGQPLVIQIMRAKTFVLDNNGQPRRKVTSTAATIAGALWDAGIRPGPGDALSSPAGEPLVPNSLIAYQSARPLTIQVAGQQIASRSTAQTVGQALTEAGITLQGLDYASPAEDQPLPKDGQIQVVRVREEIALKETVLPYERNTAPDPELELDKRRVIKAGQFGVKVQRERARFEDGTEISRGFDSDWVANEPVAETVGIGTKIATNVLETPDGNIEYWRAVPVYVTSYSPCTQKGDGTCSYSTSSGMRLSKGVIAVPLRWYRIISGLRVYVPGYGNGVIADVGGGIPGTPWIDLGYDEDSFATEAHVGWTTMYFLTPAPGNVSWTLP